MPGDGKQVPEAEQASAIGNPHRPPPAQSPSLVHWLVLFLAARIEHEIDAAANVSLNPAKGASEAAESS